MSLLSKKLESLGKTQTEIAKEVGVSQPYVANVMDGKILKKIEAIKKFTQVYNWDAYEIMRDFENIYNNENFLSHLPEPKKLENGNKEDALKALKKITSKKTDGKPKNFNEGSLIKDDELVAQKVIEIPIKGFAGLKQAFFSDDYIQENFKETTEYVRPEEKIIGVYYKTKIEKNNFSMVPTLNPGETTWNEPISEMFWNSENIFKKDKVYSLWHPYRGILFKRIIKHDIEKGIITLSSDNDDKETYEDEDFSLGEFRKILIVRKKEVLM